MTRTELLDQSEISLLGLVIILRRRVKALAAACLAGLVLGGLASLAVPATYTATTRLLPPPQSSVLSLPSQFGAIANASGLGGLNIKSPADTYVALLRSRTIADAVLDRFNLQTIYREKYRDDARSSLLRRTSISVGKEGVIAISVDDTDPTRSAAIANGFVEELFRLNNRLAVTEAQKRRLFFEAQLKGAHEQLRKAERDLASTGFSTNVLSTTPQAIVESLARLKGQITAQEIRLATMRSVYNEGHPDLKLAREELASMQAQLRAMGGDRATNGLGDRYWERYREYKYQEMLTELVGKQYELAKLDEAKEGGHVQVLDPAIVPERKTGPKSWAWALVAMIAAFTATAVLVVIRDSGQVHPQV